MPHCSGTPLSRLALDPINKALICAAQSTGVFDERFENRLKIERRTAYHLQDFSRGGLLLKRLAEIAVARLHLLEQLCVLQSDQSLIRKRLDEANLASTERLHSMAEYDNHTHNHTVLDKWQAKTRTHR